MGIDKDLNEFLNKHQAMLQAFSHLKVLVKEEGSKVIHEHIRVDDFDSAAQVVGKLDQFSHVMLETNIDQVTDFVKTVFGEITQSRPQKEAIAIAAVEVAKATGDISDAETDALKIIGYSGVSRVQDSKGKLTKEVVVSLAEKGYLHANDLTIGKNEFVVFALNGKGKGKFKELYQVEANESQKKEVIAKYGDLQRGFYLMDVESSLEKRGYTVHNVGEEQVEVSKNNMFYYLTPDFGELEEKDYHAILEKQNKLKSIGFICNDKETLENKATKAIRSWADANQGKLKFLSVNLITVDDLVSTDKEFTVMSF